MLVISVRHSTVINLFSKKISYIGFAVSIVDIGSGYVYLNEELFKPLDSVPIEWLSDSYEKMIQHFTSAANSASTKLEDPADLVPFISSPHFPDANIFKVPFVWSPYSIFVE